MRRSLNVSSRCRTDAGTLLARRAFGSDFTNRRVTVSDHTAPITYPGRLRRLRQHHELTQEQFAETIGLSYKFYQQIEAGCKKQIWLETVERLATGFGLEGWQLLSTDEPTAYDGPQWHTQREDR